MEHPKKSKICPLTCECRISGWSTWRDDGP